jgi:hypothetical protein
MSSAWFCVTPRSCAVTEAELGDTVVFLAPVVIIPRAPVVPRPKVRLPIPRDLR